ncbi:UNVERIFIED_ORG: hypothetical protein C7429_10654 [Pantoea allii]|uniref:hypothetical protein n=1 Tax=Enterobacter agglomerans TaxID=549 RepID=UPI0009079508|nr:hypothetical protein [Pantoea agglomerans]MBA5703810.1 hypothetical protein [Pantoea agglomerans]SUB04867.1 Uncharacterised protein [Pantoea agglomerans]
MKDLERKETERVTGAMNLSGLRESMNTINLNRVNQGTLIDAANVCWKPGTPSIIMFPGGYYITGLRF